MSLLSSISMISPLELTQTHNEIIIQSSIPFFDYEHISHFLTCKLFPLTVS